jgi:hypothetical protein
LHRRAALEHGDATRSVSQARLESNHAVACQAFICSADLTSYKTKMNCCFVAAKEGVDTGRSLSSGA